MGGRCPGDLCGLAVTLFIPVCFVSLDQSE